jgi:zinc and cadmium transporter
LYAIAVGLSALGSLGGLFAASVLLACRESIRRVLVPWLISYAVGTLLGVALLALLPRALEQLDSRQVLGTLLAGILTFFILEKLVIWRHCHTDDCEVHGSAARMAVLGDTMHNFIDGAIIGSAVMSSVPLGVSTALAVAAHEIPQEIGDFAILLGAGYPRRRALWLNMLSSTAGIAGATVMCLTVDALELSLPYILPFAAGSLLYVAMSDLIPHLHRGGLDASGVRQILLISAGIATVMML